MNLSHIETTTPIYPHHTCTEEDKATPSSQEPTKRVGGVVGDSMSGGGGGYAHSIAQHQATVSKAKPRYRQTAPRQVSSYYMRGTYINLQ